LVARRLGEPTGERSEQTWVLVDDPYRALAADQEVGHEPRHARSWGFVKGGHGDSIPAP
jgi:hypothetical protein